MRVIACLFVAMVIPGCEEQEGRISITEHFSGNSFDRTVWQMARPAPDVGKVEIKDESMVFTIPPRKEPREQIRTQGKFDIPGDFEAMYDYSLLSPLPDPEKEYINLELLIYAQDFDCHFSRVNHKGAGNGVVAYFAPKLKDLKSHWKIEPTTAERGTLKVTRMGGMIECAHRPAGQEGFDVIGKMECGAGPVTGVCVALTVNTPTTKTFQLAVDNIFVRTIHPEVPFTETRQYWILISAGVVVPLVGLLAWLMLRPTEPAPVPAQKSGTQRKSSPASAPKLAESVDDFDVK